MLDIDDFKFLNFSEILDKRLRESNKGKIVISMREFCEYLENNWRKKSSDCFCEKILIYWINIKVL